MRAGTSEREAGQLHDLAPLQVRHPFERLVSAYRFTFERGSGLGEEGGLAAKILASYPRLTSAKVRRVA